MNHGVATSIAILAAALVIVDVAGLPTISVQESSTSGIKSSTAAPKLVLPNEWLRLAIKNESVIYTTVGSSLELVCEGTASPPPTIKWYHEKTLVSPEAGYPDGNDIGNIPLARLTSRLQLNCITPQDQGAYYCTARTGSKVRTTSPVIIVVLTNDTDKLPSTTPSTPTNKALCEQPAATAFTPPRILVWGPTLLEFIDEDATLPCIAVGNPTPKTYWVDHDGNAISTDVDSPRFKRLSNGELFISHIAWPDMGLYTCIAENAYGTDRTDTFLYPTTKAENDV